MTNKYDLHVVKWGEFKVSDFFDVENTKPYHWTNLKKAHNNAGVPYITRTASNNGFEDIIVWNFSANKQNTISFWAESATFFYQPYKYVVWNKMYKLSRIWLNRYSLFFLVQVFQKSIIGAGFWYGKWLTGTRFKWRYILLPKDKSWNPDWDFMEGYMREKEKKQLETALSYYKKKLWNKSIWEISLKNCEWRAFEIGSLFSLFQWKSKWLNHLEIDSSGINYLGATNRNNWVMCQVRKNEKMVQKWNCIAFIRNWEWSMGYSIYKAEDFIATSDISVWYSDFLTQNIWLFITTVADRVRWKYNFWYKRSDTRLKKEKILLPVDPKWNPDWNFIELYMAFHQQKLVKKYVDSVVNKSI